VKADKSQLLSFKGDIDILFWVLTHLLNKVDSLVKHVFLLFTFLTSSACAIDGRSNTALVVLMMIK
jgi:hypothetical protein